MLLGLLKADSGRVELLGGDPWRQGPQLHRRLAYVPGDVTLWPNLTGGEVIDLLGRMRGGINKARRSELIDRFHLDPTKKSRAYSKGNRQKVALIAALAADAELLLLDEPTSGLDPLMEAAFRDFLANDRPAGQTVLLSSHILSEVEAACERVTLINEGRTVESGSLAAMRHLAHTAVSAELNGPVHDLEMLPGVHSVVIDGNKVTCQVEPGHIELLLTELTRVGVRSITCAPPSLEQLFLSHYSKKVAREAAGGV